jgi:hypothetical protein
MMQGQHLHWGVRPAAIGGSLRAVQEWIGNSHQRPTVSTTDDRLVRDQAVAGPNEGNLERS